MTLSPELKVALVSIYDEMMWLARRPNVTPGRARGWYTHIMAESVKRQLRRFTGQVSLEAAVASNEPLMLEHFMRIQTTLSKLVERHRRDEVNDAEEFLQVLVAYEQVHIVTRSENYKAMRAKGDYVLAEIKLQPWEAIAPQRRQELWRTMLRGKVANAHSYAPHAEA